MTGDPIERDAAKLRRQLTDQLIAAGAVTSPGWEAAFADVPRHVFVPRFWRQTPAEQDVVDSSTPQEWLTTIYSDQLLVVSPDVKSSSTVPSLMAAMLEALAPHDGHRVLEIGTGTGYNAALLCHRLGDDHVVSVDIAADLLNAARTRLASIGYRPTLGAGDGIDGWPAAALYDGLIATCAPDAIPLAWLDQVRPGGRIVAPIATGIAVIDTAPDRTGTGRFLPGGAFFMPLRATSHQLDLGDQIRRISSAHGTSRPVGADTETIWFDSDFRFVLTAALPGLQLLTRIAETDVTIFTHTDGSWARIDDTTVNQGGPQHLWDLAEHTYQRWHDLGRPTREHFTLTITGDHQQIQLADHDLAWTLPTPGPVLPAGAS